MTPEKESGKGFYSGCHDELHFPSSVKGVCSLEIIEYKQPGITLVL